MEKRFGPKFPQLRTWTLSHPTGADKLRAESGACLRLARQQKCKLEACATFGLCSSAHPSFVIPTGAKRSGRFASPELTSRAVASRFFARKPSAHSCSCCSELWTRRCGEGNV